VSPKLSTSAPEMLLLRYGELALKGGNRSKFEQALVRNLRSAAARISPLRVERRWGRIAVFPERRAGEVARRLQDVFGLKSLSPAWGTKPEPAAIAELAGRVLDEAMQARGGVLPEGFRVKTSRGDKSFPLLSSELDRYVAERVLPTHPKLRVKLQGAELELGIDVREERAYVFVERLPGLGGLPVGTLGRALCLLSGGIDSPVAAWLAMKRGCSVSFASFHSSPWLGLASKKKVVDLVRVLSRFQPRNLLFVVPFAESQVAIRDRAPEAYRTVLYRRMMQRISSELAKRDRCLALVTGESLGQVASQTLENLACIEEAASLPVLRPLLAYDKEESIALARRLGSYEISTQPAPDCCTVFQPSRPVIHGELEACLAAEARIDVAGLVERALAGVERIQVECED
jgi:thiamine biosynthesis protein ThiI